MSAGIKKVLTIAVVVVVGLWVYHNVLRPKTGMG